MCIQISQELGGSGRKVKCKVSQGKWSSRKCTSISREREEKVRFIFRNWLMRLWGLATLKSLGKASRLEIEVRAGVAGLSTKYVGQANRISTQARFLLHS